jgi:hypothetical protein
LKVERLTATGNGGFGVQSLFPGRTLISDSIVTGNTSGDVGSQGRPRLQGTDCGTSRRLSNIGTDQGTWGVCALD